jgi:hypothetical protein
MDWVQFKDYLSQVTDLSQDALHIYAAVLVQFAAALLLRRSLAHPLPWLCLLAVLVVNEAVDLREPGKPIEEWQVLGGLRDVWNTLLLPTALMLLARFAPRLMTDRAAAVAAPACPPTTQDEPEAR